MVPNNAWAIITKNFTCQELQERLCTILQNEKSQKTGLEELPKKMQRYMMQLIKEYNISSVQIGELKGIREVIH